MSKLVNVLNPKRLFSKTVLVMFLTGIGMVFTLLVDMSIAYFYGTTENADILILAILIPLFLDTVLREGIKFSLVPILIEYKTQSIKNDYVKFISALINLFILLGAGLTLIGVVSSPFIAREIGGGLSGTAKVEMTKLLRVMFLSVVFMPAISFLGTLHNSEGRFNVAVSRGVIVPICVLLVVTASNLSGALSSLKFIIGYLLGFFILFVFLIYLFFRVNQFNYNFILPRKEDLIRIKSGVKWPTLGFLVRQFARLMEKSIATFISPGAMAAYHFSFRIFSAIQSVVGTSVAITGLPKLSESIDGILFKYRLRMNIVKVAVVVIPIQLILFFFGKDIIELIYYYGSFSQKGITQTTASLRYLLPGLLFISIIPILNSGIYSLKLFKSSFWVMTILSIFNISLAIILANFMGIIGLSLSVSITAFLESGVLFLILLSVRKI